MKHINVVSRAQIPGIGGNYGNMDLMETAIILLLTVFFNGWDNFNSVITNLSKFYRKT